MLSREEQRWDEYNSDLADGGGVQLTKSNDSKTITVASFSHVFFTDYRLGSHLNTSCNRILQLGASTGRLLEEFKKKGWDVMGYDYSTFAIQELRKKGIATKAVDLNETDKTGALTYSVELAKDISTPVNIFLIRVLQYLKPDVLKLLLLNLINNAAPGSVFFIAGNIEDEEKSGATKNITAITPHYKASFFKNRSDMEILRNEKAYRNDELLVVVKKHPFLESIS